MLTMMTDPARKRRSDSGNPDICPLLPLLSYVIYSDDETTCLGERGVHDGGDRVCRVQEIGDTQGAVEARTHQREEGGA